MLWINDNIISSCSLQPQLSQHCVTSTGVRGTPKDIFLLGNERLYDSKSNVRTYCTCKTTGTSTYKDISFLIRAEEPTYVI